MKLFCREVRSPSFEVNAAAVTVVFLHAFPLSHTMWEPQLEAVSRAGFPLRALACDLRGFGRSAAGDSTILIEFMADDLIELLDASGIGKAVLCGVSMGGYVALRLAERDPDRVAGLVLADTRADADNNEAKVRRASLIQVIERRGMTEFAKLFTSALISPESSERQPALLRSLQAQIASADPRSVRATLVALSARSDATAALAGIRCPSLVLVGEKDTVTPIASSQAILKGLVTSPGARMEILPGAGHLSNLENPVEFSQHLLEFLAHAPIHT